MSKVDQSSPEYIEQQRQLGREGGKLLVEKHGVEYMRELGRKGGLGKRRNAQTVGEVPVKKTSSGSAPQPRSKPATPAADNPEDPLFSI